MSIDADPSNGDRNSVNGGRKSVDDVWREIVSREKKTIMKEEAQEEGILTLEDFLAKAEAMDDEIDVKIPPERLIGGGYSFDYSTMMPQQMIEGGSIGGGMKGKRGRVMMEAMDKAAAQRQKRMIKNRESAARSRERKQAYQVELETLAAKLEEENEELLKEIEERTRERYKNLMEQLIPVVEKPKPSSRSLTRSHSLE
jgi:ABA responsive element binding factor